MTLRCRLLGHDKVVRTEIKEVRGDKVLSCVNPLEAGGQKELARVDTITCRQDRCEYEEIEHHHLTEYEKMRYRLRKNFISEMEINHV